MTVKIVLHTNKGKKEFSDPSDNPNFKGPTLEINVRKNLRGDYMVMDHADIDVIYSGQTHKVVAYAKNVNLNADLVYDAQNRLFQFLTEKGVVDPESVQGGSVYSSMEADVFKGDAVENQAVVFSIGKFIEQEKPYFRWKEAFQDKEIDKLTAPEEEDSTELGEVPQGKKKGSIDGSGWLSNVAYQMYEGNEMSDVKEFASRLYTANKKLNKPSWAILRNKSVGRIWDLPDSQMRIMIADDIVGKEREVPLSAVDMVVWFDVDAYEETMPATKPVHVEYARKPNAMTESTDCRSEIGHTIGLIDSLIFISRDVSKRDLTPQDVQEAIKDLKSDKSYEKIIDSVKDGDNLKEAVGKGQLEKLIEDAWKDYEGGNLGSSLRKIVRLKCKYDNRTSVSGQLDYVSDALVSEIDQTMVKIDVKSAFFTLRKLAQLG